MNRVIDFIISYLKNAKQFFLSSNLYIYFRNAFKVKNRLIERINLTKNPKMMSSETWRIVATEPI